MRFPLRFVIPIMLMLVGVITAIWIAFMTVRSENAKTEHLVSELVSSMGNITAAGVSAGLRNADPARVRSSLEQLQSFRGLTLSLLIRNDGVIVQSSRARWVGNVLGHIDAPVVAQLFLQTAKDQTIQKKVVDEKFYYACFVAGERLVNLQQSERNYVLIVVYDFAYLDAQNLVATINRTLWVILPILLLSVLSWVILQKTLLKPIQNLIATSRQLGRGDLHKRVEVTGSDEMAILGRSLDGMREELNHTLTRANQSALQEKETAERLRQEEARMRLLLENLAEGVVSCNSRGQVIICNKTVREWYGADLREVPPDQWGTYFTLLESGGQTPLSYEQTSLMRAFRGEQVRNVEISIVKKGAPPRFVVVSADPLQDEDGNLRGAVAVMHDITERIQKDDIIRRSLFEKETLLKEIHHRVKNNLQVVSSLLDMQLSTVSDPVVAEALNQSVNRVRSMSMIHEGLYQSTTLARVHFDQYVDRLAHALFRSYATSDRVVLVVDTKPIELNIETAVPCGLILNELISNALKYAFSPEKDGKLYVGLCWGDDHTIQLTVRDNGPGLPPGVPDPDSDSLGFQLVQTLVYQLKGDFTIRNDGGAFMCVTFKELVMGQKEGDHGSTL